MPTYLLQAGHNDLNPMYKGCQENLKLFNGPLFGLFLAWIFLSVIFDSPHPSPPE